LKAFSEGEVTVQKDASNAGTSVIQIAQQVNPLGIQTHIQRVSTALPRDGKYKQLRGVDPTQLFVFCPTETPEGHGCGLLQNLASFARVRVGVPLKFVETAVLGLAEFALSIKYELPKKRDLVRPMKTLADINRHTFIVYVNSDPVAITESYEDFVKVARIARRCRYLPYDCSIVRGDRGIHISSDMGIVVFPLLNLSSFEKMPLAIEAAQQGSEELWNAMCRFHIVEYVDAYELLEYRVAFTPEEIQRAKERGDADQYTHMAVHPCGFLGTSASSVPWPDHDQAPRVAYQAGMVKQAISTPASNLSERMDLGYAYELWYPQKPVADTAIAKAVGMNDWPMGENLIIAIAPYGGGSQEDSIIRNKASVDRGSGRVTVYRVFKSTCRKRGGGETEHFEHPLWQENSQTPKCEGIRGGVNYSKIGADGFLEEGTPIRNGDVIIGRVMRGTEIIHDGTSEGSTREIRRDRSTVMTCEPSELYYVDKVMLTTTKEGWRTVRVKLRSVRIPQEGDKISSRHGQKGTIGTLLNEEDMPYVMSGNNEGMRPDAIINLHCINGRMTIGKLLEILMSSLGLVRGEFVDATPFRSVNARWAMNELLKAGYGTEEIMVDGTTGVPMNKPWFIGSCFYQTLKHMVLDKITVRQRGQRAILTRQPLDGRANQGGQRMGEMEKDAFLAHGAAFSLDDRSRIASDAHNALVCHKCGHVGDSKEETLRRPDKSAGSMEEDCRLCGSYGTMVELPTTYCYSRLLLPELATCGIKVVHKFSGIQELSSNLENQMSIE
jgi:DNA-directed RNA polymerase II subunit RPB2